MFYCGIGSFLWIGPSLPSAVCEISGSAPEFCLAWETESFGRLRYWSTTTRAQNTVWWHPVNIVNKHFKTEGWPFLLGSIALPASGRGPVKWISLSYFTVTVGLYAPVCFVQLFLGLGTVGVWDLYNSLLLLAGPPNSCLPTTVSPPLLMDSFKGP